MRSFGPGAVWREADTGARSPDAGTGDELECDSAAHDRLPTREVRLAALQPVTAGICHEFNNILNVILGCGHGLRAELTEEADTAPALDEMLAAAQRGSVLIQQLLAFSQQLFLQPGVCDLNALVHRIEPAARSALAASVSLTVQTSPEICPCEVDTRYLEQALMTLIRFAGAWGDRVALRTSHVQLGADELPDVGAAPGAYAQLSIAGTGGGLDPDALRQLFEPFYSSKALGMGEGLGLAAVHGLVRQHGGWITADSAPGVGTVFTLSFPSPGVDPTPACAVV